MNADRIEHIVFDLITTLCASVFQKYKKKLENFHPIRAHFKGSSAEDFMRSVFNGANAILFSNFLYKGICCGYSFELPQLVEEIQMSTHNICFIK